MERQYRVYYVFSATPKMKIHEVVADSPQDAISKFIEKHNEEKQNKSNVTTIKSIVPYQTEHGANVKVELLNGSRKSISYYFVVLETKQKEKKEVELKKEKDKEIDKMITVEMSTNVIECITPDTYGSGLQSLISEDMWAEFETDVLLKFGEKYLKEALQNTVFCKNKIFGFKLKSPSSYNYSTDSIEFMIELPIFFFKKYFAKLGAEGKKELFDWCKDTFKNSSGFISQMPKTQEQFEKYLNEGPNSYSYNFERALGAIMSFEIAKNIDTELYQQQFMEDVIEYAYENGYSDDDEFDEVYWGDR